MTGAWCGHRSPTTGLDLLQPDGSRDPAKPEKLLDHLTEAEVAELTRLLELARKQCGDAQARRRVARGVRAPTEGSVMLDGAVVEDE